MPIRHLHLHRRDDGLAGFGNIAHEIGDASDDMKRRHVEKRDPQAVRTVYKTLEATFEGQVGGYRTVGNENKATKVAEKDPKPTASDEDEDEDEEEEKQKKKEAEEEKKKQQEEEEEAKEKAEEEAEEEAKKKAEAEKKKKEAEEEAEEKQKELEEEKAKSRSKAKAEEEEESTTAKPTRTRIGTTTEDASSIPSVISHPTGSQSLESVLAEASDQASVSNTIDVAADLTGSSTISASSETAAAASAGGSSAGTKAGIAFGVLGGLLAVGLLVFFIFSKRRKQAQMERLENDDEKLNGPIGGGMGNMGVVGTARAVTPEAAEAAETASVRTDAKAPRVSLRPVTQFLPNWNGLDKRTSKGAGMALAVPAATTGGPLSPRSPGGSAWERPSTAQSTDSANPFGAHAERVATPVQEDSVSRNSPSPVSEKPTIAVAAAAAFPTATVPVSPGGSVSPQSPSSPVGDPLTANGPPMAGAVAAGAAGGAGAALLARKTSMRKDGPKHLDLTLPNPPLAPVPASPAGTEFSTSSATPGALEAASTGAAAIAAAGGPTNSAVHRVQLDFKPTLDDELELRAGELVRLLHEYDDGWALCIRLDRSRQGVVPRTCLSTRPVKPRPAQGGPRPGPPVKSNGPPRGPGPNHAQGQRPMTPQGQRPMTPQGNFGQGRPASPAGSRSQSPMGRPMGPPGHGGHPMSPGSRPQSPAHFQGPPAGRSMSPGPRSQSPGPRQGPPDRSMSPGPRSQSPGPAGGRSQSPIGANRRNSPPGPSPMNPSQAPRPGPPASGSVSRKPVPGQAY